MKLHYSPGVCSLSPHIVLNEGGFTYDTERVDLATGRTETGADYKTINPNGYVPVLLLDDGQVLTEGPAIVRYLADIVPEKRLAPACRHDGTLPPDGMAQLYLHRTAQGLRRVVQPASAGGLERHRQGALIRRPTLTAYLGRVAARPAVQAALKAEGLV